MLVTAGLRLRHDFFAEVFLPTMRKLVEAGLSYDEVKRLMKIPTTWGAKITGKQGRLGQSLPS